MWLRQLHWWNIYFHLTPYEQSLKKHQRQQQRTTSSQTLQHNGPLNLWPWMRYIWRRLLKQLRQIDRRTNSHSHIENRHARPKPRLRLSYTVHILPQWHTSPSTHTPLTFDLHLRPVATLTSLYNVPLLTSVDVMPLMKTAGVVENSEHCIYSIGLKCFWNWLSLYHLVLCLYIYSLESIHYGWRDIYLYIYSLEFILCGRYDIYIYSLE